jgi:uncharacterized phiE125 gp8 family phage protein
MTLRLCTGPTAEPLHLTEAKLHLRAGGSIDAESAALYTEEDATIKAAISAARMAAEAEQWRALVLQTWDLYLSNFPGGNSISLPFPPLRAVEFVRYTDSLGVVRDFEEFTIDFAGEPGRVVLNIGEPWPSVELDLVNPVHIRFKCGYLVPFTVSSGVVSFKDKPFVAGDIVRLSVSGGNLPEPLAETTDYFITETGFSLTDGGDDIALTSDGTGSFFVGVLPHCTNVGMKLIIADLYEERADTVIGRSQAALPATLPRAAVHWFSMDSAKFFV